ncbi:MAG: hypothetical protein AAFQ43_08130 [Bacteroidota bacterium]
MRRRLSPLLPLAVLIALALPLAACGDDPVDLPPHEAEADSLLASVTGDAWDAVFPSPGPFQTESTLGGEASGKTLLDSAANPLPAFLSDEPPYLDAAATEQYATCVLGDTTVAGQPARLVEARFVADGRRAQPIRLVRAAVAPEAGTLLAIEVHREVESTLFDETSRLVAALASGPDGLVLDHSTAVTTTDVPASEPATARVTLRRQR